MCGITGFLSSSGLATEQLLSQVELMASAIAHRGPDGCGFWTDRDCGVALGHRRLSVVDLSDAGGQPMESVSGRYLMVYNGEVYNAPDLAHELKKEGANFRGSSDSEVILEAFSSWGIHRTLALMIGMFAIALWDRSERKLYLVRDRLGIKPLYWTQSNGTFAFASDLKALKVHPDCPRRLNDEAMANYLCKSYVEAPSTIYEGVHKLLPGHVLTYELSGKYDISSYWSLDKIVEQSYEKNHASSFEESVEALEELIDSAVSIRMISDVPIGAFLSGGVDSSLVTALMQKNSMKPIRTFAIGYEEPSFNEAPYAAEVAKHLGTDHTELYVNSSDALEVIPLLSTIYDEPFSDPSQIPMFLLSKLTREHVTVALSGDGGDELFAGYDRYFTVNNNASILRQPNILRQLEASLIDKISPAVANRISSVLPRKIGQHLEGHKLQRLAPALKNGNIATLYAGMLSHVPTTSHILASGAEAADRQFDTLQRLKFNDNFSLMQYKDMVDYLPNDILTKVDRATMAVSLEARVPLIDHRLVEFSWSLPLAYKTNGKQGKHILREVLYKHVPKQLIERPKMGFRAPIGEWLRNPLKEWAEDMLSEESLRSTGVFNMSYVQQRWKEHQQGKVNWEYHLWDIISLQAWVLENK